MPRSIDDINADKLLNEIDRDMYFYEKDRFLTGRGDGKQISRPRPLKGKVARMADTGLYNTGGET